MKIRNKKTGLVIDVDFIRPDTADSIVEEEETLEKLVEEWEDYEEPKDYWYIASNGEIMLDTDEGVEIDYERKEFGNYFATVEEAQRVLEKLKIIFRGKK